MKKLWSGWVMGMMIVLQSMAGEAMSARDIMKRQSDQHKVANEYELQQMVLMSAGGSKEMRKVQRFVKEVEKDVFRALVVFLEPSDIKGVGLLSWQHKGQADDQWLYLPAQGKLQRVASGSKKNYFMGTDFTYEDLETESLDSKNYQLLREEKCGEQDCYVIEAKPKDEKAAKDSSYGKRILWIRKDIFASVKVEFYDKREKLMKTMDNRDWIQVKGDAWRASKSLMDNHKTNHKTLIASVQRDSEKVIAAETFTEKFILKGLHTQERK